MNLIAYPHYTCGGLLCDILNNTFSKINDHGGIGNPNHSWAKVVGTEFNVELFNQRLERLQGFSGWVGTHTWANDIDQLKFDQIIQITTTTFRSKIYRWARAYYHYYSSSLDWLELSGMDRLDKERETAKDYLQAFLPATGRKVINVEFSEVVEGSGNFYNLVKDYELIKHIDRWKTINNFLYAQDFWTSTPVQRYYEAELEVNLNKFYVYQ